ncbi:MAG: hypothetical protein JWR18_3990 [Segetibacter sp.]|jgi:hypothetical protein|nr:hypothetical protein [Segetibacter sp.]
MRITLIRNGGIIPMTKKAEKDVDWSEDEMKGLLKTIKNDEDAGEKRDASGYQVVYNAATHSIDWDKIPAKYKKTFEELKDNLKIVKT